MDECTTGGKLTLSKWNQYRNAIMNQEKPDEEKLIRIATLMRTRHKLIVKREPFLLFDKNDCRLVKIKQSINKWEYNHHITHNPDLLFYINNTIWIMEIDGWIHDHKNTVIEKDKMRNEHYLHSGINHIIISESLILHNIGIDKKRGATADELWPVINSKIKKMLKKS